MSAAVAPTGRAEGGLGTGTAEPKGKEAPPAPPEKASERGAANGEVVLEVRDLRTFFFTYEGVVKALDGVTFQLRRGETLGMVGETGCGKSVTALSITRLVADPPGRIFDGYVMHDGADLLHGLESEAKFRPVRGSLRVRVSRRFRRIRRANARMEAVRGQRIAMIFQEPTQALNPVFSVANQVGELILLHHGEQVIHEMLGATTRAPDVGPATEHLLTLAAEQRTDELRPAAEALGRAARSPRLGTEAYYAARATGSLVAKRHQLHHAIGRLHLHPLQRGYLRHHLELLRLREELNRLYFAEMQGRPPRRGAELELKTRRMVRRLSRFYYGIYGFHRWLHRPLTDELFWRVVRMLEGVRIANPVQVARGYPHELSGGMIQRVMIAMALSADPAILLADEPTTALDVTIQAQILALLEDLRQRVGTAILLITHDLAVIAEVADRVCVMYAGRIVEQGPVREVFHRPLHPYTQGLVASIPRVDEPGKELRSIPGAVPDLIQPPSGCRFHPRCPHAMPVCSEKEPPVTEEGPEHHVACYLYRGTEVKG